MEKFTGFVKAYTKPSHWWRRQKTIDIPVWPRFLAQLLCPHEEIIPVLWDLEKKTILSQCCDCHKRFEKTNACVHGEVTWWSWSKIKENNIPQSFRCNSCSAILYNKDLPKNVKIVPHPSISAARDH